MDGIEILRSKIDEKGQYSLFTIEYSQLADAALAAWIESCFSQDMELKKLKLKCKNASTSSLLKAAHATQKENYTEISRERFYQLPWLWKLSGENYPLTLGRTNSQRPSQYVASKDIDIAHPLRASKPSGWVYQRYDAEFKQHIAFRVVEPDSDLEQFHHWQNEPHVANFWEMAEGHQTLHRYLIHQQNDPHSLSLIGHLNGEAFGYFEVYWCQEDRLGAYYDTNPYDRGWHGLTGCHQYRGKSNTITWMKALCHYLFLDDPRTERVMGEPRADNTAILKYQKYVPYQHRGEFDFPHKRAALMQLNRSDFFNQVRL